VVVTLLVLVLVRVFGWEALGFRADAVKACGDLVLRHQVAVLRRQVGKPVLSWADRALARLVRLISNWWELRLIVSPRPIVHWWHAALVRRRWTYHRSHLGGQRPRHPSDGWCWRWPATTRCGLPEHPR
jgi:hypothetical protein